MEFSGTVAKATLPAFQLSSSHFVQIARAQPWDGVRLQFGCGAEHAGEELRRGAGTTCTQAEQQLET